MSNLVVVGAVLSALAWSSTANALTLCFASAVAPKTIRLQLTLPQEGSQVASVRYERGGANIPLLRTKETGSSSSTHGPTTVRATFSELLDGQRTGEYVLTTTGGAVGDLVYVRFKDKKTYTVYEDQEAAIGDVCDWSLAEDRSK